MALTAKQEKFCQSVASGMSQADAYRSAYDAGKMKAETVQKRASELMGNREVAGRVSELRKPAVEAAQLTLTQHLLDLQALRDAAIAANQFGPAITAETNRGKASGLYVETVNVNASVKGSVTYKANIPKRG